MVPYIRLNKKTLGPAADLWEGTKARDMEVDEGEEVDTPSFIRKGKKATTPRKTKQGAPSSTYAPRKTKVTSQNLINVSSLLFLILLSVFAKFSLC